MRNLAYKRLAMFTTMALVLMAGMVVNGTVASATPTQAIAINNLVPVLDSGPAANSINVNKETAVNKKIVVEVTVGNTGEAAGNEVLFNNQIGGAGVANVSGSIAQNDHTVNGGVTATTLRITRDLEAGRGHAPTMVINNTSKTGAKKAT